MNVGRALTDTQNLSQSLLSNINVGLWSVGIIHPVLIIFKLPGQICTETELVSLRVDRIGRKCDK